MTLISQPSVSSHRSSPTRWLRTQNRESITLLRRLFVSSFPLQKIDDRTPRRSPYRRLVEILESEPDKERLVEFLPFHRLNGHYLDWDDDPVIRQVDLHDVVFDAYAVRADHGMNLILGYFTEAWKSPFGTNPGGELKIREEIMAVVSAIDSIRGRLVKDLSHDLDLQAKLWDLFAFNDFVSRHPAKDFK